MDIPLLSGTRPVLARHPGKPGAIRTGVIESGRGYLEDTNMTRSVQSRLCVVQALVAAYMKIYTVAGTLIYLVQYLIRKEKIGNYLQQVVNLSIPPS